MATTECVCSGWLLRGRDILVMPVEACSGQNFATSNIYFETVKIKFHSNFILFLLHNWYFSRCLLITCFMCKFFSPSSGTNWFFVCLLMLLFNGLGVQSYHRSSIFCSLHHKKYQGFAIKSLSSSSLWWSEQKILLLW